MTIILFFRWLIDLIINHRYKLLCEMYNFKYKSILATIVIKDATNKEEMILVCSNAIKWLNSLPKNESDCLQGLRTRCETLLLIHKTHETNI